MLLKGLSAFPITPADQNGAVDVAGIRVLVRRLQDAHVHSIGLLGSTGTYAYLTAEQRLRALEAALDEVGNETPIFVGVGALRTDDATRIAREAKYVGAAAGLLAAVSYTPLTDDEVFEHFKIVAHESGLPICIYDNPGTTHFRFSTKLIARLSCVDGIIGVKSLAPEKTLVSAHVAELRSAVPKGFSVGYSGDWNTAETLIEGADAWHSVIGGLFPKTAMAIVNAVAQKEFSKARELNARLEPLWTLFKEHSSLRVMYASANILGLARAEPPRPLLPINDEAQKRIATVLKELSLD
jgi:4-hydroxy-tetrahydrodipicolinate synthase